MRIAFLLPSVACLCLAAQPSESAVINGNFESGNLNGWTTYTTSNGTLGVGYPQVVSFDVDGDGNSSSAAAFQVGQVVETPGVFEGGGIFQNFTSNGGSLTITADIASSAATFNLSGGLFELFFDGLLVDSFNFGSIAENTTERASLSAIVAAAAGNHQVRFQFTRRFLTASFTPIQYIDNIVVTEDGTGTGTTAVPEPGSLALLSLGGIGLAAGKFRKRRQTIAAA